MRNWSMKMCDYTKKTLIPVGHQNSAFYTERICILNNIWRWHPQLWTDIMSDRPKVDKSWFITSIQLIFSSYFS